MIKLKIRSIIVLLVANALCTCIDPYTPKMEGYESLLVIEGLITNENASYEIKLSRTIQSQNSVPEKVSDALVSITDNTGSFTLLRYVGNGVYKTDSTTFTGEIGRAYTLHITTVDGNEYESDPCVMLPVPEIDSVYYKSDVELTNNQSETHQGIRIYINSKEGGAINNFLRWDYIETWKFKLPEIKRYNYINEFQIDLLPESAIKNFCWNQQKSKDILVRSSSLSQLNNIKGVPIAFIGSDLSDRLSIQYSILIKQYSISEKESEFWNNLKNVNESGGDIFGSQPFFVPGNITNVNDKNERVLGYFQVSAVSQKRKDIGFSDIKKLNLPPFHYSCERIETAPGDYCSSGAQGCVPPTWDELNKMWTSAHFTFIEPYYDPLTKKLAKLIFASANCSNCELTGTSVRPSFWTDLN